MKTTIESCLSSSIHRYIELKQALGRRFTIETRVLELFDTFMARTGAADLTEAEFEDWCKTQAHLSPAVRRNTMRILRNYCLYRRRTDPHCFVPDRCLFPAPHQAVQPHIFSELQIARLLQATTKVPTSPRYVLRPLVLRLAVVLLYTTGLRRGELLRLTLADYDQHEQTLLVRDSKFHKSRYLPLSADANTEIATYLVARRKQHLPMLTDSPLLWSGRATERAFSASALGDGMRELCRSAEVRKADGRLPRVHDYRHSFALHVLLRWYRAGVDLQAKLPLLATYMGHVSIASTEYYLPLIPELALEASNRFCSRYGAVVQPLFARCPMKFVAPNALARAVRGFFGEYVPELRGLSRHTLLSYRDTLALLLRFLAKSRNSDPAVLDLEAITRDAVLAFLNYLEQQRHNKTSSRNVRLAAIHAFFRYVAIHTPERIEQAQRIIGIPFKRTGTRLIDYLDYDEIVAVLGSIDRTDREGRRDYALLALLFNSGARVQEIVDLGGCDLQLEPPLQVKLVGKGRKTRICPLWPQTAQVLKQFVSESRLDLRSNAPVFCSRRGERLSRFGIRYVLAKYCQQAVAACPSLAGKRLHPHSMRHSCAIYLLKSGVDLPTISHWLGHASINTTNRYATADLEMKRQAIARAGPPGDSIAPSVPWRHDASVIEWLESL